LVEGTAANRKAEVAIAIWLWCSAGITVLASLLIVFNFDRIDFKQLRMKTEWHILIVILKRENVQEQEQVQVQVQVQVESPKEASTQILRPSLIDSAE
jgi:hypothetical protein